jgi:hypothetical protein
MFSIQVRLAGWGADTPPEQIGAVVEKLVEALALANAFQMRSNGFPALAGVPIRYDLEGNAELFDDATMVASRRSGDCDDLCAYRLGELWASGEDPGAIARVVWQPDVTGATEIPWQFHVQVQRSDGSVEDPSAELGMGWLVNPDESPEDAA